MSSFFQVARLQQYQEHLFLQTKIVRREQFALTQLQSRISRLQKRMKTKAKAIK